jgi:hypothetical protein
MKPEQKELPEDILHFVSSIAGKQVQARASRLNVCATGAAGFGAVHDSKDTTPKSEDSEDYVGTLMVILPSGFMGGNLIINSKNKEEGETLNWAEKVPKSASDVTGSLVLPWAFVSADTQYRTKPVDSGVQLILSYDMVVPKPWMESSSVSLDSAALAQDLQQCLSNPRFLPEGGKVAFALMNAYPVTPSAKKAFKSKFHHQLRGADARLYSVATKLGLKVEMRTVYKFEHGDQVEKVIEYGDRDAAEEREGELPTGDSSALGEGYASLLLTSQKMTFFTGGVCPSDYRYDRDPLLQQMVSVCEAKAELDVIWARQPSKGAFSKSGAYAISCRDW